jgi:hypothetical protein
MTLKFTARAASVDDEGCLIAGIAERADGTGRSLIFQADGEPPDQQEIDLGWDTYCLVTETHGTAYGCVEELRWEGNTLRLLLRPGALSDLGLDDMSIEVDLAASDDALEAVREALREILAYGREDARPRVLRI